MSSTKKTKTPQIPALSGFSPMGFKIAKSDVEKYGSLVASILKNLGWAKGDPEWEKVFESACVAAEIMTVKQLENYIEEVIG